jgi:putative effector of murein hydrolase
MNESKITQGVDDHYKSVFSIQMAITIITLVLFLYLAISDNMMMAPFFYISLSLCFFISGYRLYKKNRVVSQKRVFYFAGIVIFIIAIQDFMQ